MDDSAWRNVGRFFYAQMLKFDIFWKNIDGMFCSIE